MKYLNLNFVLNFKIVFKIWVYELNDKKNSIKMKFEVSWKHKDKI